MAADAVPPTGPFEPGRRIEVVEFPSRPQFEGRKGVVCSYHPPTEQWLVQLDGEIRKRLFKADNLQLLEATLILEKPEVLEEQKQAVVPADAVKCPDAAEEVLHSGATQAKAAPLVVEAAPKNSDGTKASPASAAKSVESPPVPQMRLTADGLAPEQGYDVEGLAPELHPGREARPVQGHGSPRGVQGFTAGPQPQHQARRAGGSRAPPAKGGGGNGKVREESTSDAKRLSTTSAGHPDAKAAAPAAGSSAVLAAAPQAVPKGSRASDGATEMKETSSTKQSKSTEDSWKASLAERLDAIEKRLAEQDELIGGLLLAGGNGLLEGAENRIDSLEYMVGDLLDAKLSQRVKDLEAFVGRLCEEVEEIKEAAVSVTKEVFVERDHLVLEMQRQREELTRDLAARVGDDAIHRVAAAQEELDLKLLVLQEFLSEGGSLCADAFQLRLKHRRFADLCAASDFHPEATLRDVLGTDQVFQRICAFGGPALGLPVRAAAASMRGLVGLLRAAAEPRFEAAISNAASRCVRAEALGSATALAELLGDEQKARTFRMLHRGLVLDALSAALAAGSGREELEAAVRRAEELGADPTELAEAQERINGMEAQRAAMLRKLRAAAAWVQTGNLDKLRALITEAEEAGLDAEEIEKAKAVLQERKEALRQQAEATWDRVLDPGLQDFLQCARPAWTQQDLFAVKGKLYKIGVCSVEELKEALSEGREKLTQRLRTANTKTFSAETLQALEAELERRLSMGT